MKKIFYYIFIPFILISCKNVNDHSRVEKYLTPTEIVVETIFDNKINLSEIFTDVFYTKLESNLLNTIGSIDKMILHDNKLYIFDSKTLRILIFDINGNYLFQINNNGRGPGEFLNIEDFIVDSINSKIEIWDNANRKILRYDKTGNFENEKKFEYFAEQFCKITENRYLYFFNNYPNKHGLTATKSYNILILDSLNQVKQSFLPLGDLAHLTFGEESCLQKYGNGVNVVIPFDNNIYYVTENGYSIKYKVNFTNYLLPKSFLQEFSKVDKSHNISRSTGMMEFIKKLNNGIYVANIHNIFEHPDYLTFQYHVSKKGILTVFFDKNSKKIHVGFPENDIDYGLFGTPLLISKDTLFTFLTPYDLKNRIELIDSLHNPTDSKFLKLKLFSKSIKDDDNPIIIKLLLK